MNCEGLTNGIWDEEIDKDESSTESCSGWIQWFCSREGNEFLCEVDEDYILDGFNLYKLKSKVNDYAASLNVILGYQPADLSDYKKDEHNKLYGLIHARFILTQKGLQLMKNKFDKGVFGVCPRFHCKEQSVLPIGLSNELNVCLVCSYCPWCQECYESRSTGLDGAFFGSSFPSIFVQTFPEIVRLRPPVPSRSTLYGYKVVNRESLIQVKIDKGEYGWQNYLMHHSHI